MDTQELLYQQVTEEAGNSLSFADSLDTKANIWLVLITFLAAQSAYFLKTLNLSPILHNGQIVVAIFLAVAATITLAALRPMKYILFQPSNGTIERRIEKLKNSLNGSEDAVCRELEKLLIGWAKERSIINNAKNRQKGLFIEISYWLTACAALMNFLTLFIFATNFCGMAH